ncbi:CD109 antigen isoform X1 [Xenopus laevis]|uniref:CD109 antigen isoform X1 n=2 Tax=Xenopus laevis TaxID=8355 RepID=A0A8J0TW78_XENLA|nr:CD109 antigen isoform X1 [Xenopus laevis]
MPTLWPPLVKGVVCFLFILHCSDARPSYMISAPTFVIPGVSTTLAVHWFGQNHSEISVTAEIWDNGMSLANNSKVFQKDFLGLISIPPLSVNSSSTSYLIRVYGTAGNELLFSNNYTVELDTKNVSLIIETDKSAYQPGQAVKIRIISIFRDLRPYKGLVNIVIRDPQSNIIKQWLQHKPDLGVISAEFLLSSNAMAGTWRIQAETDMTTNMGEISVIHFDQPKFDVTIKTPSFYVDSKQQNLIGTVIANYTYGRPVKGNATVLITALYDTHSMNGIKKTYAMSGAADFTFTYAELSSLLSGLTLNITAVVTEELTGIEMSKSTYVKKVDSEYELIIVSQPPVLNPGINFTTKIQLQRKDLLYLTKEERENNISVKVTQSVMPQLVENTDMNISTAATNLSYIDARQYTIPESGIINIVLPLQESIQLIIIEAVYQNITQKWRMQRELDFSSYAQIQLPDSPAQVGKPFDVKVKTKPEVQHIHYVIMAGGIIVSTEKTNSATFTLTPEYSWAPAAVLMVYFFNFNNMSLDIIQASRTIDIKGMFENKVSLSWSITKTAPSENVILSVNVTEARSLVALRVVDISDKLLSNGNNLKEKVETEIKSYSKGFMNSLSDGSIHYNGILPEEFVAELLIIKDEVEPPPNVPIVFPETWIWLETNISSGNRSSLPVTVPDAVTSWMASAFVISDVHGLGVTEEPVELQAFQPFFITLNAPYAVTRGEQFILRVLLFNYLEENLQVNVSLETNNAFAIIIPENDNGGIPWQRNVSVRSKESEIIFFPISPMKLGAISITVRAMSRTASDSATQKIRVKADGVQNFYTQNLILEVNGTGSISKQLSFTFPTDVVSGSEQASVSVVGDFLGPSIKGLESLIRMPYGCGEQNMINFAPNIYVLQYLITTSQLTEDIRRRAISYMEQGYQRELNYKRDDNSFSAFGNTDSSGSSWLSSFVVRCFLQARSFINISPELLNKTVEWLIQQQDQETGKFLEPGHVFHTRLQGGLNGPITLTAYILTSLLENSQYRNLYASRVDKAVQYLEKKFEGGISSNYTLSIVAYALSVANSTKASAALTQLNSRTRNNGGLMYWSTTTGASNYWQPPSADIETAAYALLSHCQQNRIAEGVPIMNWLVQQRNNLGGYSSTQDTIMALQALAQFMAVIPLNKETSLAVSVTGSGSFAPKSFQITNENLLDVQIQQIDITDPMLLNVSAVGRGIAIFQLNVIYNKRVLPRHKRSTPSKEAFTLDVTPTDVANNTELLYVAVCSSYQGTESEIGMVLLDIGFLNGFILHPKGIPESGLLKMVERKEDKVYLYFESMTKDPVCVTVLLVRNASVAGSRDAVVTITDYYNPTNSVTRTYNSDTMKKISICDFCESNCTLCQSNVFAKAPSNSTTLPTFTLFWFCLICICSLLQQKIFF